LKIIELGKGSKISEIDVGNKESPYVVGYRYEVRFNELGVGGARFYAITESTLDYGKDSFNHPSLTV